MSLLKRKKIKYKSVSVVNGKYKTTTKTQPSMKNVNLVQDDVVELEAHASTSGFNIEEHNACEFLLNDEVVPKKKKTYQENKEKELKEWDKYSADYLQIFARKFDSILPSICTVCKCELVYSSVWCQSCGPASYYCRECVLSFHQNVMFHNAVEISVSMTKVMLIYVSLCCLS